jgi:hypothetical protein
MLDQALPILAGAVFAIALLASPLADGLRRFAGAVGQTLRPLLPLPDGLRRVAGAVARTLRPLPLPLFVVIAVGAVQFGILLEILVGFAATVAAWLLIVAPSARECGLVPKRDWRAIKELFRQLALWALLTAVMVWALGQTVVDSTPYSESIGLTAGLVNVAVALWSLALFLRIVSFAETRIRAAIAVLTGLTLLWGLVWLGILPSELIPVEGIAVAIPLLLAGLTAALLILDVFLEAGVGCTALRPLRARALPKRVAQDALRLGLTGALATSVVLLLSTILGLVEMGERGDALHLPPKAVAEAPLAARAPGLGDRKLDRRYAPVLVFTKREHWTPIKVDSYLRHATLIGPEGPVQKGLTLAELPHSCPGGGDGCYQLTIECDSGEELRCAHHDKEEHVPGRLYREGAVYVRGPLRKGRRPGLFPDRGPFRNRLRTLIQYWYFYYYDEWKAPVFAGLLTQKHESDWEVVTLGLDKANHPLFVADSAHCAGSWRRWGEVKVSTALSISRGPDVHPLIAVAEGSHANYPDPKQKRTPDPAHCAGLPAGIAAAISYASNIRDKTEYGFLWYPPENGWIELRNDKEAPMDFPGTWGADGRVTLTNYREHEIGNPTAGPRTPSLQAPWTNPVGTIFCGKYSPPAGMDSEELSC